MIVLFLLGNIFNKTQQMRLLGPHLIKHYIHVWDPYVEHNTLFSFRDAQLQMSKINERLSKNK